MKLTFSSDLTAAAWLTQSTTPADQLISFGPAGFEAYARLRFIPDPAWPGQSESAADLPDNHASDIEQTRSALHWLKRFTSTPDDCFFLIWEGYSDIELPPAAVAGALVDLPDRRYAMFHGSLDGLDDWEADFGSGNPVAPPAFVWPADHRWCFTSDVDPHWAGIGAERAAVEVLAAASGLDVVRASPSEDQSRYAYR